MDLNSCITKDSEGNIVADATLGKALDLINDWNANRINDLDTVGQAIDRVYDLHSDTLCLNMAFLKSSVCAALGATPDTNTLIAQRVADFVKANPVRFTARKGVGIIRNKPAEVPATE